MELFIIRVRYKQIEGITVYFNFGLLYKPMPQPIAERTSMSMHRKEVLKARAQGVHRRSLDPLHGYLH